MSKHTPGPWTFQSPFVKSREYEVASVTMAKSDPVRAANARLIAAAPDLLDALYAALQGHKGWDDEARAAITKAEGTS